MRVKQVLDELVRDAVRMRIEGNVEVFLGLTQLELTQCLDFGVIDTRTHISAERIEKFAQFFKNPSYNMAAVSGYYVSIGLMTAILLCDLMKGKMWIEDQVDKGSTFHFAIPYESS